MVADTVAAPIEQQVNGVENMLYMSSQCTNDGTYILTDHVQERRRSEHGAGAGAEPRGAWPSRFCPTWCKRRGVTVKKKSPSVLMMVNLFSPDGTRDNLYLSNYATIQLKDELSRLPGVGDITYLGQRDYSMRLWLDPEKMASRNLSTSRRRHARSSSRTPKSQPARSVSRRSTTARCSSSRSARWVA